MTGTNWREEEKSVYLGKTSDDFPENQRTPPECLFRLREF
jgi:hypothetical protein